MGSLRDVFISRSALKGWYANMPLWVQNPEYHPATLYPPKEKVMCFLSNGLFYAQVEVCNQECKSSALSEIPNYCIRCLLLSPAMRSEAGMAEQTRGLRSLRWLGFLRCLSGTSHLTSGPVWYTETWVNSYQLKLRNISEDRRPQLHRSGNFKSRDCFIARTSLSTQTYF
jgi:hypothetical protein